MLRALLRRGSRGGRRPADLVLAVDFEGGDGRRWSALGGGPTVDDAIAFACDSLPAGTAWRLVGWDHLYAE
jgi:hypothetical protein